MTATLLYGEQAGLVVMWGSVGVAYLLGSIPFGLLVVRLSGGQDVRTVGSGNIGATNVSRAAGLGAGLATLLLDAGKGLLAVWLASWLTAGDIKWMSAAAAAAVVGHIFPVWLRFRGGRGVAPGAGAFVLICGEAVAAALLVFLVVVVVWRYVSLGSVLAAASLPALTYFLYAPGFAPPHAVTLATTLAAVLIILRHSGNIRRIVAGTEPRISRRKGR
jgi:acyl phosphate:glycerol-3-phosphate acyltransferase